MPGGELITAKSNRASQIRRWTNPDKQSAQPGNGLSPQSLQRRATVFNQVLVQSRSRRPAPGMDTNQPNPDIRPASCKPVRPHHQNRQPRHRRRQRISRRRRPRHKSGKQRTPHRRAQCRRRAGRHHRRHLHRHGAMMRTMPSAASRQTCVVAAFERPSQGPQPEEQNQRNGEQAPHLIRCYTNCTLPGTIANAPLSPQLSPSFIINVFGTLIPSKGIQGV